MPLREWERRDYSTGAAIELGCGSAGFRPESSLSVATIRRAELTDDETSMTAANDLAVRRALEAAGVEFIDENGGGSGVRLRKPSRGKPGKA
jgi:hypothetical protein